MTASLIRGDAGRLPLADQSVHLIVTSPPYWALRSYQDGGAHYDGQLGSEPNPFLFLVHLWVVMDECWRVLRDDGSCWVNLGDKFAGSGGHNNAGISRHGMATSTLSGGKPDIVKRSALSEAIKATRRSAPDRYEQNAGGLRAKSRMLLPHRFAEGCQDPDYRQWVEQRAGLNPTVDPPQWICRMDVVWSKPSGMPESVTDRPRAAHEYWFQFAKSERYFAAMDAIREPHVWAPSPGYRGHARSDRGGGPEHTFSSLRNSLGKLPGSVWAIPSEPLIVPPELGVDHFAAFPSEFPRRIVLGWSPSGVCTACGDPRRPVVNAELDVEGRTTNGQRSVERRHESPGREVRAVKQTSIVGYACSCPTTDAPARLAVVLDPFSGTGTTAAVASALGRHGIGVELSADYNRLARWRCEDPGLRAKVLGVDKPKAELAGQASLFDGLAS